MSVVGNFNEWNPFAHPLRRRANRTRSAAVRIVQALPPCTSGYLAQGGVWFDNETIPVQGGRDVAITV